MDKLFNRDVDCTVNSGRKSLVEHFCDEFTFQIRAATKTRLLSTILCRTSLQVLRIYLQVILDRIERWSDFKVANARSNYQWVVQISKGKNSTVQHWSKILPSHVQLQAPLHLLVPWVPEITPPLLSPSKPIWAARKWATSLTLSLPKDNVYQSAVNDTDNSPSKMQRNNHW
jgi:hypothetical protein